MRYLITVAAMSLIVSCLASDEWEEMYFDGRKICIDKSKAQLLSSTDIGVSGLDKSSEILRVVYRVGDLLVDKFVDLWGEPTGNIDYVSYSLMKLNESEIKKYRNHQKVLEAFNRQGSFKDAIVEELAVGFAKVRRKTETYTWQVFNSPLDPNGKAMEQWVGECTQYSKSMKCSFFDFYKNYLVDVDLSENFLLNKADVMESIKADLRENVFCEDI